MALDGDCALILFSLTSFLVAANVEFRKMRSKNQANPANVCESQSFHVTQRKKRPANELCSGSCLKHVFVRGKLEDEQSVGILIPTCRALGSDIPGSNP